MVSSSSGRRRTTVIPPSKGDKVRVLDGSGDPPRLAEVIGVVKPPWIRVKLPYGWEDCWPHQLEKVEPLK